jgi:hypothetical protein
MTLDAVLLLLALAVALSMRPWRSVATSGPPRPWLAWWAVLPLFWGADKIAGMALVLSLSSAVRRGQLQSASARPIRIFCTSEVPS